MVRRPAGVVRRGAAAGIDSIPFHGIFFSAFYGGQGTNWGPQTDQQA